MREESRRRGCSMTFTVLCFYGKNYIRSQTLARVVWGARGAHAEARAILNGYFGATSAIHNF